MRLKTPLLALAALACAGAVVAPAAAMADPYDHSNGRNDQYDHSNGRYDRYDHYNGRYEHRQDDADYRDRGYGHHRSYFYRHFHHHYRPDYRFDHRR